MNISALTLHNFKGVSEFSRIDIKPITLLFGPNSSGKSTLLQALVYANEILNKNNLDPDYTSIGGEIMDLGGFENIIHKHDKSNKIIIGIELDVSDTDLPDSRGDAYDEELIQEGLGDLIVPKTDDFLSNLDVVECQITIAWDDSKHKVYVESLEYIANGHLITRISSKSDLTNTRITYFDFSHPIFESDEDIDWVTYFIDSGISEKFIASFPDVSIPIYGCIGAIPQNGEHLQLLRDAAGVERLSMESTITYGFIATLINRLLGGSISLIRERLERLVYIGPLREVPERDMNYRRSPDMSRWARGMAAWDILHKADKRLLEEVNHWLSDENRLNSGYIVNNYQYRELPVDKNIDDVEIDSLPIRTRFTLKEIQNNIEVYPRDVGVGISQVIPVIVAAIALRSSVIAIEQPELHIHPALQVSLGDLFAAKAKDNDSLFLLETHSEHLMLRLLRRVREKSQNELPEFAPSLSPDDISVIYVQNTDKGVSFSQIRIDEEGEFIDRWPKGFFGERAEELF